MIPSAALLPGVASASPATAATGGDTESVSPAAARTTPSTGGITDGGFETGTFPGWTKVSSGTLTSGHSSTLTLTSHDDTYTGDPAHPPYDNVAVG